MTREESIKILKAIKKGNWLGGIIDIPSDESIAFDMAIKALSQESIFDKISAEIRHFMYNVNPNSSESDYACDYILNIINKYKAESEK